jgi:hypothetical protein
MNLLGTESRQDQFPSAFTLIELLVVIQGGPATQQTVLDNPALGFLGEPGEIVNVLPQEETEGAVFLGIAGDEIESGMFQNETVHLNLVHVQGPGAVFLYSIGEFGDSTL